jgi:hypothetical protein
MGIISGIFGRLRRKEEPLELPKPKPEVTTNQTTVENVKTRMELVMTQLDSLRVQNEILTERIKNIEKLVTEIRSFCR